jgi:hypothetical protein
VKSISSIPLRYRTSRHQHLRTEVRDTSRMYQTTSLPLSLSAMIEQLAAPIVVGPCADSSPCSRSCARPMTVAAASASGRRYYISYSYKLIITSLWRISKPYSSPRKVTIIVQVHGENQQKMLNRRCDMPHCKAELSVRERHATPQKLRCCTFSSSTWRRRF